MSKHVDELRKAFLAGAKFWEWRNTNSTMWQSDQNEVMEKAIKKYPMTRKASEERE